MARRRGKRANGEGTITQREDGRWMAQLSLGFDPSTGKRIRKTVYGDTQGEVKEKLEALKDGARDGQAPDSKMPLRTFLDLWLDGLKGSISLPTHRRYSADAANLKTYLGDTPLADLTAASVIRMYKKMREDEVPVTVPHTAGTRLRRALKAAVGMGYLQTNVAAKVPLPRIHPPEIRPLTPDQVERLLTTSRGTAWYPLWAVAIDSGARAGELFALEWKDWDPVTRELSVTKTTYWDEEWKVRVKEPKTRYSRRKVVLSAEGAAALHYQKVWQEEGGLVTKLIFPSQAGGYMRRDTLSWHWEAALRAAGLPDIRLHDLRHTSATLLLASGVDPKTVAERLGHANTQKLFEVYAHVLPATRQRAASVLGGFLRGSNLAVNEGAELTQPPRNTGT